MDDEIELVSDGDGVMLFGDAKAIDLFLVSEGLESRELDLKRLIPLLGAGGAAMSAAGQIAENAGRWVKLTEKSAQLKKVADALMTGSTPGAKRAILTTGKGKTAHILEIVQRPTELLANPAVLAGVGGLMAQMAMQRQMDEIADYLAVIDQKVDDILRAQKDSVLAGMIAAGLTIDEALTVRQHVGRVSEVTWSKVQNTSMVIASTQAYALRQLDALAEKLERDTHVDALAKTSKEAGRTVQEWLVVLARCFQLHDGLAVLELDRVLDAAPHELEAHRLGLKTARQNRLDLIARSTSRLLARMDATAGLTNTEVLLNPFNSRAVVEATNRAGAAVNGFHAVMGIDGDREALEARRWVAAAESTRDAVLDAGAEGVGVAVRLGNDAVDRARKVTGRFASDLGERLLRPKPGDGEPVEKS